MYSIRMKDSQTKAPAFFLSCILALCVFPLLFSCTEKPAENGAEALTVTVSILPHRWFVSEVAKGNPAVAVNVLAGEGQNPHSYEPTTRQIQALAESAFWLLSGSEFEIPLLPKIRAQFPSLHIVDGTAGVTFRQMEEETGSHPEETHTGNIDRHSWLGEQPALLLAGHICGALCQADPANAELYRKNAAALKETITAEFASLREKLEPLRGVPVFVFHPSFGYFLDEFGIRQEAVETGGKEPTAKTLAAIIGKARRENPKAIFVQAQFPVAAAKTLADSVGAEVVPLDPLAENWLQNIRTMGGNLAALTEQE